MRHDAPRAFPQAPRYPWIEHLRAARCRSKSAYHTVIPFERLGASFWDSIRRARHVVEREDCARPFRDLDVNVWRASSSLQEHQTTSRSAGRRARCRRIVSGRSIPRSRSAFSSVVLLADISKKLEWHAFGFIRFEKPNLACSNRAATWIRHAQWHMSVLHFLLIFSESRMSAAKISVLTALLFLSDLLRAEEPTTNPPQAVLARGEVVQEGNSGTRPMLFRIGLAPFAAGQTITLAYSTEDDNATSGEDYEAAQGTVTLSPTATFAEIPVSVIGDTEPEPFEVLRLVLRDPAAAPGAPPVAVAIGGIDNDDVMPPPPGVTFSVRGEAVLEGDSGTTPLRFTVSRTNSQSANSALNLRFRTVADSATAGSDFQGTNGDITLQPNQASVEVTVNVIGDTTAENFESFRLEVSDPTTTIPPQIGFGGIFDDDGVRPPPPAPFAIPFDAFATEPAAGESEARLALRLDRPATQALRFTFAANPDATATAGVDFIGPITGELNFAVGDLVKDIPFRILADNQSEGLEFVAFTIAAPEGVVLQRNFVLLTISDRPASPPPAPVSAFIVPCRPFVQEGDSNARLLVRRTGDTSGALSVNFATQDGTALAGSDYTSTSGVLNWVAGNAEFKRVDVPIIDDQVVESPERFVLRLTDSNGQLLPGRSIAPIVILDGQDQIFVEDFSELCTSEAIF